MTFRKLLSCLVIYFVAKATLYAIGVPPWQAPDETLHFEVAELRHRAGPGIGDLVVDPYLEEEIVVSLGLHDFWRLTGQIEPDPLPRTLGSSLLRRALPLYYNLLGLLFGLVPSSPLLNLLYVGRLTGVLFGGLAVVLTARATQRLLPGYPIVAFGAASVLAFVPQIGYMSGALSPDALVLLVGATACWLGITIITRGPTLGSWCLVGLTGALCLLTKRNLYFLVPLLGLCPLVAVTKVPKRQAVWWILAVGAAMAVLAVGPMRTAASRSLHEAALNLQTVGNSPAGWWNKAVATFWRSSLASLGWLRLHAHRRWYEAAALLALAATGGLVAMLVRWSSGGSQLNGSRGRAVVWLVVVAFLGAGQVVLGLGLTGEELPQGRHLFPVLPALSLVMALGLRMLVPGRGGVLLIVAGAAFLLAFDLWVMWRVALPGFYL